MADPCCNSFGGRITIEADGMRLSGRGDITIDPATVEVTGDAHQDGTAYFSSKPKLPGWEVNFSDPCEGSWDEKLRKCKINVTIVEHDNGRTHLFTGGRLVGTPKINVTTGEVTGLGGKGGKYRKISS